MIKGWLSVMMLLSAGMAFSQTDPVSRTKQFNLDDGIAIRGYDPVDYFTQHKAVKGSKDDAFTYNGVVYYFSSPSNKILFQKTPEKYEPQYGGWCAYAMGKDGSKVEVDPGTFKIIDGKLFLFYNHFFTNTLPSWNKDEVELHKNADINWQKIYH